MEVFVGLEYSVKLELRGSLLLAEGGGVPLGLDGGRCGGGRSWCVVLVLNRMVENRES